VIEILENERNIYQTPYHLEGNVRAAGFVDIEVRKVKMIFGEWTEGCPLEKVQLSPRSEIEGGRKSGHWSVYGGC
jgi:hypothetical protein